MAPEFVDPRMTSIKPRIRYNTIGGVNGPLVILDNVRLSWNSEGRGLKTHGLTGQISTI